MDNPTLPRCTERQCKKHVAPGRRQCEYHAKQRAVSMAAYVANVNRQPAAAIEVGKCG